MPTDPTELDEPISCVRVPSACAETGFLAVTGHGVPRAVTKEVRRLSTGELHAWRECGEISETELRSLLDIEPGRRYLAARFPEYRIDSPVHLRRILEKLIKRVDPREPYSDQGLTAALQADELTGEQYDAFRQLEALDRLVISYDTESHPEAFREGLRVAARRLFQERKDPHIRPP